MTNSMENTPSKKPLMYLDTSVVSYLEQEDAPEKMIETRLFWEKIKAGEFDIALSEVTIRELDQCPEPKRLKFINHLKEIRYSLIKLDDKIESFTRKFIENEVLTEKSIDDCRHIACSIVYGCDIIVSWNFKHIVNYKTIDGVKRVSLMTGYKDISIYTPAMLLFIGKGGNDDL